MKEKTAAKIELYGLKKVLSNKVILNGFDLTVFEGETYVIIGQSGAGKSVLLKHIIGLMKPDEGEIYIDGINMTNANDDNWVKIRKQFGMLFQGGALFDSHSVGMNLLFALDHIHPYLSDKQKNDMINQALEIVGLHGIENLMPADLSGGMKKRVALARAIVAQPAVVLFDEPTSGLDPIMTATINQLIADVKHKLKTTFIVVTHDITSAKLIGDRIGMIYKGKLIFSGTPKQLETSNNKYVKQFIHGEYEGPITDEYFKELELKKNRRNRENIN